MYWAVCKSNEKIIYGVFNYGLRVNLSGHTNSINMHCRYGMRYKTKNNIL